MTRRPRRNHTPGFKLNVALAAVRGESTLSELTQQYDVHPNQIKQWCDQFLAGANDIFGRNKKSSSDEAPIDVKMLHVKIIELTLENDFLEGALTMAVLLSGDFCIEAIEEALARHG